MHQYMNQPQWVFYIPVFYLDTVWAIELLTQFSFKIRDINPGKLAIEFCLDPSVFKSCPQAMPVSGLFSMKV